MGASAAAFAVDPAAMLNEFGTVITAYQLGRPKYSKLPTHILLFDTDVAKSSVSEFIARHLYIKQATFFHAHVATDVHASSDPGYMLLYVHPCWLSLMAALWATRERAVLMMMFLGGVRWRQGQKPSQHVHMLCWMPQPDVQTSQLCQVIASCVREALQASLAVVNCVGLLELLKVNNRSPCVGMRGPRLI
jgi:hypothetical protein